ncbi:MAG: pitrilysin family protein [Bacteroidota bacterium]
MQKFIRLTASLFAVLFATTIMAQTAQQNKKLEYTEYDLPNGLHVILHQDNSNPIVAVSIMYHVGSKNENADRTGFAHFFEHLMFEGSPNIKRGEYFKMVQNAGGVLNANTSWDRTYYFEILPSNQFELGMWMEAERLLQLRIDSTGVETQRGVVKEERKQGIENRPYGSLLEQTFSHAYTKHPYRWTPIGSAQYIDQATIKEFRDFHDMYYVPDNAVLSIAGDFDMAKAKEMIKKYYGDIPRGKAKIVRPTVVEPPQIKEVRDTVLDNIQLPAVIMAYHMPAQGTDDSYAMQMLTTLLSDGESSRMYKTIVDQQQKAMYVGAFPLALEDPGLFLVFGIVNMGIAPLDLENAITAEIEKVQKEELGDREFEKLRNKMENDFVTQNSSMSGIAENLANYYMYFKNTNLINTEIEKYMKVTKADIKRVANTYLKKENRVVLYYLPKNQN